MAKYSGIPVAALAAFLVLSTGMQVAAADDLQETDTAEEAVIASTGAATESENEEPAAENGWVTQNGKQYYMLSDGSYAVGETEIDGIPYLFGFSGALKTDWQTIGDKRYYYDPATGQPVYGWVDYFGSRYYVTAEDGKLTGFQEIDGVQYAFAEDGALYTGEFYAEDVRYYAAPETGVLQEGIVSSGTESVVTDADGIVVSGWYETDDGRTFYSDPVTGQAALGLVNVDGDYYYFTSIDGMVKDVVLLDGNLYPFNANTGALADGWYVYDGVQYYFDRDLMATLTDTLTVIDGVTYYFDEFGMLTSGWRTIGEDVYWFGTDGVMFTGVLNLEENTYLLGADGKRCSGWNTIGEQDYFFREDGTMAKSDTIRIGNSAYTFDENGLVVSVEETGSELDVISYKQKDELWANEKLGTYSTIGKAGCLVTSMAMVHSYKTGEVYTPVDMRDMLSFTSGGALSSWDLITDLGYTVETISGKISESLLMKIYVQIQAGCPVVLGSKQSSGGQHYVVVTGYVGDGESFNASDFTINDPGYTKRFYLSDHLAQYPTLYKLIY